MGNVFYVDGVYVTAQDAMIPITDLSIIRGYGVFDFCRTYNGQLFHLDAHLDRLFNSASEIELPVPWSKSALTDIIQETIARNGYPESNVRIIVTGGDGIDSLTPIDHPRLLVMVTEGKPLPDHLYTEGAKVITVQHTRSMPQVKSLNYTQAIYALRLARRADAVEAIYVNEHDQITEGTTTNIFAFLGDTLVTPDAGILPGITRGVVMELADDLFTIETRPISKDELLRADEVFITASNKQIMPIVQIDDHTLGNAQPGLRTRRIMDIFGSMTGVPLPSAK